MKKNKDFHMILEIYIEIFCNASVILTKPDLSSPTHEARMRHCLSYYFWHKCLFEVRKFGKNQDLDSLKELV